MPSESDMVALGFVLSAAIDVFGAKNEQVKDKVYKVNATRGLGNSRRFIELTAALGDLPNPSSSSVANSTNT